MSLDPNFQVPWTEMQHGTREHYAYLGEAFDDHARGALIDNLLNLLGLLKGPTLGYQCDRYSHSLQSGTRAYRNNESVDMVVAALLHDIADGFAPTFKRGQTARVKAVIALISFEQIGAGDVWTGRINTRADDPGDEKICQRHDDAEDCQKSN